MGGGGQNFRLVWGGGLTWELEVIAILKGKGGGAQKSCLPLKGRGGGKSFTLQGEGAQ